MLLLLKYIPLPDSPTQLINNSICTQFHRVGLLRCDCEEGYSPFVLLYNLSCARCPDGHENWWKFSFVGFMPFTFFYFFVVLFNINVTSSHLHRVVGFSQAVSMPILTCGLMLAFIQEQVILKAVKVFYSFWNLHLFCSVIPDVSLNVTNLQALAMEYLVHYIPISSYFAIKLYDRKIHIIVTAWKSFQSVFYIFQKSWIVETSLIDTFATFFLLSYVKIMNVTMDLLFPTKIHQLGSNTSTLGFFSSSTLTCILWT